MKQGEGNKGTATELLLSLSHHSERGHSVWEEAGPGVSSFPVWCLSSQLPKNTTYLSIMQARLWQP